MRFHLVRHGRPAIDRDQPASTWHLDPDGFAEIDRLRTANVLPYSAAVWFSSTEPKAMQTARQLVAGSDIEIVGLDRLREADRPADWMSPEAFEVAVVGSMERPGIPARPDWETTESVRKRTLAALLDDVGPRVKAAGEEGSEVVLVGHGTAWTVLVAAITQQPPDLDAWRALQMPDHCTLDLDLGGARLTTQPSPGRVVARWGSWADA